jgi:hypothetical protein
MDQIVVSLQIGNDMLKEDIRDLRQEINYCESREIRMLEDIKRLENTIAIQADKIIELENKVMVPSTYTSLIKRYLGFN